MRWLPATILPKDILAILRRGPVSPAGVSQRLLAAGRAPAADVLGELETCETGFTEEEALRRLDERGPNVIASEHRTGRLQLLGHAVLNPLVLLATVSFLTGDPRAGTLMSAMVLLTSTPT